MKNKSTYSLLINADSEEKGRSIFEAAIYSSVVLATALSVFSFATGSVVLPGMNRVKADSGIAIEAPAQQPIVVASTN